MASDAVIAAGDFNPPSTSRTMPCRLVERDGALVVIGEDGRSLAIASTFRDIAVSHRVGSVPRRLTFTDGSLFETRDNDAIDRYLQEKGGNRGGLVHGLEKFHPRLAVFIIAVLILSGLVYRYALPALVEIAVVVTPQAVPDIMSASFLKTLDTTLLGETTLGEERRASITNGFGSLVAQVSSGTDAYRLVFRKGGTLGANAFALPDGTVILTDELVRAAGGDRDMILGILAHEIGHVEKRHSLRQIYRMAGITGFILLATGDIGDGAQDILVNGTGILALSYSREAEMEADRYSVDLMRKTGLDPLALTRFFAQSDDVGANVPALFLTHPGMAERKQAIIDYDAAVRAQAP